MDTGSGYDLVARNEVPSVLMGFARHADEPLELHTANGATLADEVVDLQVGPLLEVVSPLLLDSTPAVLSIGRRCMKDGYGFHWEPFARPYVITPQGCKVTLEVEGDVPYLNESAPVVVCPASGSSGSSGDVLADSWEIRPDGSVVRVRRIARTALFPPNGEPDIPTPVGKLSDRRVTTIIPTNGGEVDTMEDSRRDPIQARLNLGKQWMGHTTFFPVEEVGMDELLEPGKGEPSRVRDPLSLEHLMTHRPKLPNCPSCQKAKMQKKASRRKKGETFPGHDVPAQMFGDLLTADHFVLQSEDSHGLGGETTWASDQGQSDEVGRLLPSGRQDRR